MDGRSAGQQALARARGQHGAGSGSAGQRGSVAPLPDAHPDAVVLDAAEFDVAAAGEDGVALQQRTQSGEGFIVGEQVEGDGVRIAHAHAEEAQAVPGYIKCEGVGLRRHRYAGRFECGRAHVHGDALNGAICARFHIQRQDSRQRLHPQASLLTQAGVVEKLAQAAQAIAAHLRLAAVAVQYAHAGVCLPGGQGQDQPIRAYAEMAVAQAGSQSAGLRDLPGEAIQHDKVVADAVHLGKLHAFTASQ